MYRIEVAPGEETVFRTIEELAIGIRNGVITPRARIYHAASQKWLPIEFHPHYKKALEGPVATPSHPPPPPPTTPNFSTPPRVPAHPPAPAAVTPPPPPPPMAAHPPAPKPVPTPKPSAAPKSSVPRDVPPPMQSPVVAMQSAILRDLPVVSMPEPGPLRPQGTWPPILSEPIVHPPVATRHDAYSHVHHSHLSDDRAPLPTARRSRRKRGHPFVLLGVAVVLVVGTHFVMNANPSASVSAAQPAAAPPPVDEADDYSDTPPPVDDEPGEAPPAVATPAAAPAARVTIAPARVPMTPGPAFAGSVPARPRPDSGSTPKAAAPTPAAARPPAPASPAIEPAPAGIDLGLPAHPGSDSLAPGVRVADSLGIKRILRALNGAKPAEAKTP